jgi:hypothetical protein
MSRQDTVVGIYNYPVPLSQYSGLTETALLAPNTSGYYPGFPSPTFPLGTSTNPVVLWQGVSPDIAGGEFDGHAFEVKITGTATGPAGTSTLLMNLYQATNAVLTSGATSTTYAQLLTHPPSGTGISKLSGTSTVITLTSAATANFTFSSQFIWDSASGKLNAANVPVAYANGATMTGAISTASVSSVGASDLNFFPTFTWATTIGASLTLKEFAINRL